MASSTQKSIAEEGPRKSRAETSRQAKPLRRRSRCAAKRKPRGETGRSVEDAAPVVRQRKRRRTQQGSECQRSSAITQIDARRLDPFTQAQKDKLLQLRDAMVDSMAGVAQDNLRARAEGSEA